ncbi:heterogeneous nuclear ribonucleoprotein L isoform X17 [Drosophila kikkawai]|uniref:Heterogeneous nuclear ribonucleoprotein L isoform X17 n=1 Tax=Drosophila kikkawai TaxID=30033 RepID=A0ABM4GDI9_DROKI|nr:heterogeneous nuclear ribonucleoprotein L isoform X13 [Drosophila kikkawai]
MPYNGASNGSGGGGASGGGGGATIVVTEGPQNKKIRTGVQQPGENDVHMHARSTQQQNQQQALMNKSNDDVRRKRPETTRPNHILLFTIINPFYPITVDVLHKICHPHGQVLRIVIFKKNGVQAMVEFDNLDAATRARENLNGADIYAGCCTLKIDYAKPEKLNVYKNEPDTSWDYTLSTGEMQMQGTVVVALDDAAEERAEKWENTAENQTRRRRRRQRQMEKDQRSTAAIMERRSFKAPKPASQIIPALILLLMLLVQLPLQPQRLVVVIKRSRI